MKDGKQLGPAFAQAQDEVELLRRRQLAALSDPQRKDYEALCRRHEAEETLQRQTLQAQEKRQIAERTERHLWRPDPAAHPRRLAPRRDSLSLDSAVEGAVRRNDAAQFIAQRLKAAQDKARAEVDRAQAHAIEQTRALHQRERDAFLDRAGKERHFPAGKQFQQQRDAPERLWHEALLKASRSEKDRSNDRDHGRDHKRDR